MQYYGTRLSENISRREPEGYLLCLNVPVARTGTQEYLPEELGMPSASEPVSVYRPEEEVFAPETIASFEGMPVTNNHPPGGVTAENIRALQKGHAHNVRRGSGEEADLLLADLIITDPGLIDAVLAGKREISCGYTYELREENGRYIQRKIRGNHVAVVDAGRAGPRVSIKDRKPEGVRSFNTHQTFERSTQPMKQTRMKKSLLKKITRMARDGDPDAIEALAEAVEAIAETPSDTETAVIAAISEPSEEAALEETGETVTADSEKMLAAVLERLDRLIALLAPKGTDEEPEEAEPQPEAPPEASPEKLPEELAEVVEEALEAVVAGEQEPQLPEEVAAVVEEVVGEAVEAAMPDLSTVLEPDEEEEEAPPLETGDMLRLALTAVKPALKRMSRRDRKRVCADIAARLGAGPGRIARDSRYSAMVSSPRHRVTVAELGKQIMAKRNPNYR